MLRWANLMIARISLSPGMQIIGADHPVECSLLVKGAGLMTSE